VVCDHEGGFTTFNASHAAATRGENSSYLRENTQPRRPDALDRLVNTAADAGVQLVEAAALYSRFVHHLMPGTRDQ